MMRNIARAEKQKNLFSVKNIYVLRIFQVVVYKFLKRILLQQVRVLYILS